MESIVLPWFAVLKLLASLLNSFFSTPLEMAKRTPRAMTDQLVRTCHEEASGAMDSMIGILGGATRITTSTATLTRRLTTIKSKMMGYVDIPEGRASIEKFALARPL
jgi:hypothetical protein